MSGLDDLKMRLNFLGGASPTDRANKSKVETLKQALNSAYQSTDIKKIDDDDSIYQCLINADKLVPDYDMKIISTLNEYNFQVGDAIYWPTTNSYWLIYLQELTETAYFRTRISRCKHSIKIQENTYYVVVQGPSEKETKWNSQGTLSWNSLNNSLFMYIQKNEETLEFFKRFNIIELEGKPWKIEATDNLSVDGIIEVYLSEEFSNSYKEFSKVPTISPINIETRHIEGPRLVNPYDKKTYIARLTGEGAWAINDTTKAKIISSDANSVELEIITGRSGKFNLIFSEPNQENIITEILIESI